LAEDTVKNQAELVSREEAQVCGGDHADADAWLAGGPGTLGLSAGRTAFSEDRDNLRATSGAMQRGEEGVGAIVTFAGKNQDPFRLTAEQRDRFVGDPARGEVHQLPRKGRVVADERRFGGRGFRTGKDRQAFGAAHGLSGPAPRRLGPMCRCA
jgi:hypothetical protein